MGMFDSFYLEVKCPHCGETSEMEFQTKQFNCQLDEWRVGDEFLSGEIQINDGTIFSVYGGCKSETCDKWTKIATPNIIGFGRRVYADVLIIDGKVARATNVRSVK